MTHGRAQQQTVTIGGRRDGTVLAYRLEIVQDSGAYPKIGAILPFLTILMTPGPYEIPQAEAVAKSVVTTPRRWAPTAARAGPRPRPRSSGPSTCSPPRSAWTRPTCGGATCCRRSPSRTGPRSARSTTPATTPPPWTRCSPRPATTSCAGSRPSAAPAAIRSQLGIGLASYVEITGMGDGEEAPPAGERHRRGSSRRDRDDPHRHLPARPGPRHRLGHAGQRGARHPGGQDHAEVGRHRPDPRGRRHRRLAQPAARRLGGAAGVPGADRGRAGARRQRARGQPGRPALRRRAQRVRGGRRPGRLGAAGPAWPRRNGWSCARCSPHRGRPSRSGRTSRSSRWTPRPARWCCAGS